jgi:hypothetical protein
LKGCGEKVIFKASHTVISFCQSLKEKNAQYLAEVHKENKNLKPFFLVKMTKVATMIPLWPHL